MARPGGEPAIVVTVARTGGFAGLRTQWRVTSDDSDEWMPLIEACPWDTVTADPHSRDRYIYTIEVTAPRKRRTAAVPEASLVGPWKELVEKVQST
ncbi:MAG: hypothetical protein JWP19_1390 [Rhodoglobus sp.]|nr:hypothetical protein [Rhodoglobus sp.]